MKSRKILTWSSGKLFIWLPKYRYILRISFVWLYDTKSLFCSPPHWFSENFLVFSSWLEETFLSSLQLYLEELSWNILKVFRQQSEEWKESKIELIQFPIHLHHQYLSLFSVEHFNLSTFGLIFRELSMVFTYHRILLFSTCGATIFYDFLLVFFAEPSTRLSICFHRTRSTIDLSFKLL